MFERKLLNGDPVGEAKILGCIEISGDERCVTYSEAVVLITAALCLFLVPFIVIQHHRRRVAQNYLKQNNDQNKHAEEKCSSLPEKILIDGNLKEIMFKEIKEEGQLKITKSFQIKVEPKNQHSAINNLCSLSLHQQQDSHQQTKNREFSENVQKFAIEPKQFENVLTK